MRACIYLRKRIQIFEDKLPVKQPLPPNDAVNIPVYDQCNLWAGSTPRALSSTHTAVQQSHQPHLPSPEPGENVKQNVKAEAATRTAASEATVIPKSKRRRAKSPGQAGGTPARSDRDRSPEREPGLNTKSWARPLPFPQDPSLSRTRNRVPAILPTALALPRQTGPPQLFQRLHLIRPGKGRGGGCGETPSVRQTAMERPQPCGCREGQGE